jgi:hypothetical protein
MQRRQRSRQARVIPDKCTMQAIYAGQRCLGFLWPRGRGAIEAFDADDLSLGIFNSQAAAADAVCRATIANGS